MQDAAGHEHRHAHLMEKRLSVSATDRTARTRRNSGGHRHGGPAGRHYGALGALTQLPAVVFRLGVMLVVVAPLRAGGGLMIFGWAALGAATCLPFGERLAVRAPAGSGALRPTRWSWSRRSWRPCSLAAVSGAGTWRCSWSTPPW